MEFLIVCIIIAYLLYKNNSLKKSSSNLNQKTYKINIEQNNNSNVKQNYKSTEEKIESIRKVHIIIKKKNFGIVL